MSAVLQGTGLRKIFRGGDQNILEVLADVQLEVHRGEMVAIVGASGAGKSTLLHLLGALDRPSAGEIVLNGVPYSELSEAEANRIRNREMGFVFQFHHLLREFSALENVMMPLRIGGVPTETARGRAEEILAQVGLAGRMTHRPTQLSGGEQQRCAVARALVHDPKVVLADEPSGNLDYANSARLHDLLTDLTRSLETALVVATHDLHLAQRADRVLLLQNGRLRPVTAAEAMS